VSASRQKQKGKNKMKKEKNLFEQLLIAKIEEEEAKQKRIELEQKVFEEHACGNEINPSGQTTIHRDGWKTTIKHNLSYHLDDSMYSEVAKKIPEQYHIHKWKLDIDKNKLKLLSELSDATGKMYYKRISDCVEMKIGKISVNVEREEK